MNFYRTALAAFVIGNVILFTAYMRIASQPWEAALVFFGYVLTNMPIAVSVFTAAKIDKTLKGHWLNWLNMLIPIVVGTVGLVGYSTMALKPSAHPAIFYYGPLLITPIWCVMFAVLVMAYVFTTVDSQGASRKAPSPRAGTR